jgi:hypothetical protein
MAKADLSRYARFPQVFYVDKDGSTKHYPSLSWCEQEPDGTVVCDGMKEPELAVYFPPLTDCDGKMCHRWWLKYDFVLYPNYEIEEVGEYEIIVRRSDSVRFRLLSWLWKTILLELARSPSGVDLFEFVPVILGWMATARPDLFKEPTDQFLTEQFDYVVDVISRLYYEMALIDVKRVK